jgi:hypothetical protein
LALGCTVLALRARAQEAGMAVYVRTDSDRTVVVAPRLRVQARVAEPTRVSATYAADVWTSASIDIRTSASKVPVTEQRDEIDLSIDHEFQDANLTLAYRYSTEPDYVSHGLSGGFSYDFADNNTTFALGLAGNTDTVGRAGDPEFSKPVGTLGGRLSFTQVLGPNTLGQLMYEVSRVKGYQASAYRYVAIGGGVCTLGAAGETLLPVLAPLCVPESSPDERLRHAVAVELRRAFGESWSIDGGYRVYFDDWGLMSHTVRAEVTYAPALGTILAARYRLYVQGAAEHYRSSYLVPQPFVTSDKELSPLTSHRLALEFDRVFEFANGRTLTLTWSVAPIYYAYSDFVPLDSITAFEVNAALVFVL